MLETLAEYLSFPFVRNALIVGILISLCASLLGVTLVLKRYSFIGDGLSHVAFGAMAFATLFKGINDSFIIMPLTMLVAVALLSGGDRSKLKGDSAIAMLSVGALAFGYLIMNIFGTSSNIAGDVCTTLFGSASFLTLSEDDVRFCMIFSIIVIVCFVFMFNRIFAVTFDEIFARATGIRVSLYRTLIALLIAVVIVTGMELAGSLLISALVIFPALSAMRIFTGFKGVIFCSAFIAVICAVLGMVISILAGTPVGATIVAADIVVYLFCALLGRA